MQEEQPKMKMIIKKLQINWDDRRHAYFDSVPIVHNSIRFANFKIHIHAKDLSIFLLHNDLCKDIQFIIMKKVILLRMMQLKKNLHHWITTWEYSSYDCVMKQLE